MFEGADSKVQDRILHELQDTLVLDDNSLMRLSFKLQKPEKDKKTCETILVVQ